MKRHGILTGLLPALLLLLLLPGCTPATEDPPVQPPEEETPAAVEAFAYTEIVALFSMDETQLQEALGAPVNRMTMEEGAEEIIYEKAVVQMWNGEGPFFIELFDNLIEHPRGVKIGDDVESVLAHFPDDGDESVVEDEDQEGGSYRVVYGEYVHMSSYGVLQYRYGEPAVFIVTDHDFAVEFRFEEGVLTSVVYRLAA